MPIDIIEMLWGCTTCHSENKGRFKTCQNCGKPRSKASPEWLPSDTSPMAAVKDPELVKKFKAGEDWRCRFCESSQFRANGDCAQCGSPQELSSPSPKARAKPGAVPVPEGDPFPAPLVGGSYRVSSVKEKVRHSTPSGLVVEATDSLPKRRWWPSRRWLIGLAIAASLGVALYFVFRTRVVEAQVTSVAWTRTIEVERYQIRQHEGWDPEPGAFETHDLGPRVHHHDHVQVGSHRENYQEFYSCGQTCTTTPGSCYTTPRSCTSNKNGSATCSGGDRVCSSPTQSCVSKTCERTAYRIVPDYEDQPRYQEWYSWRVWAWGHERSVGSSGSTLTVAWPSDEQVRLNAGLSEGEKEREQSREEHYHVFFDSKSDTFEYEPKSVDEFQRFSSGSSFRLKVGVAHGVEVLP